MRLNLSCEYSIGPKETNAQPATTATIHPNGLEKSSTSAQLDGNNGRSSFLPELISRNAFIATTHRSDHSMDEIVPSGDRLVLGFDDQYTKQVLDIISRDKFQNSEFEYFDLVHDWFPILGSFQMFEGSMLLRLTPKAEFADLKLCICLMTQRSRQEPDQKERLQQLYHTAKGLHYLVLSTGRASIEVVQAGLVIALFEYSQGLHNAAYSSIGACARMGYMLGFDMALSSDITVQPQPPLDIKIRRKVWWAIVILERYVGTVSDPSTSNRLII